MTFIRGKYTTLKKDGFTIEVEPPTSIVDMKHRICKECGHYYFLHVTNFRGDCDACDSPEYKSEDKCEEFKD